MGRLFQANKATAEAAERSLKQTLLETLQVAIRARSWTQAEAGYELGLDQAKISKLLNGHLADFSAERLVRLLAFLGHQVDISVRPVSKKH
jgi:predicted XRE-type DNA-binding protein